MLKLKDAADLDALGLPADLLALAKGQLALPLQKSDCRTFANLVSDAKSLLIELRLAIKAAKKAEALVMALHWRAGKILQTIKDRCPHGQWEPTLNAIGIRRQRAKEYRNYTVVFASEAEAARHTVRQANRIVRKDPRCYNCYENCFRTSDWLRAAIVRDYGLPGLDVCASHGTQFGERWYAPRNDDWGAGAIGFDGLAQDWRKDCQAGKVAWCNSPYFRPILVAFTQKCYDESQRGLTICQLLPPAEWSDNYKDLVLPYAEIRRLAEPCLQDGFGPKEGKAAAMGRSYINVVVAIWRKDQRGFEGEPIYPVGKEHTDSQIVNRRGLETVKLFTADEASPDSQILIPPADGIVKLPSLDSAPRLPASELVTTVVTGNSADLIERAAKLYFKPGMIVADVTFGRGVFWRQVPVALAPAEPDANGINLLPSDLYPRAESIAKMDCRSLTYKDGSVDVVVLDPPFGNQPHFEESYKTKTTNLDTKGVARLYRDAMIEAVRVIKPGGLLVVKCQDQVRGGKQRRYMIRVWQFARNLGLIDEDRFVLIPSGHFPNPNPIQKHARKMESYLWVFKKPRKPKPR